MYRLRTVLVASSTCLAAGGWIGANYFNSQSDEGFKIYSEFKEKARPIRFGDIVPLVSASSSVPRSLDPPSPPPSSYPETATVADVMKFGFPSLGNIRNYGEFVVSFDRRTRNANWVFEHITPDRLLRKDQATVDRTKCQFVEDSSIHPYFRATNEDYKNSGYDRGHLAAAGNYRHAQTSTDQTFLLTNISPQVGKGFNRDAWNSLEKLVRAIARKNKSVYICTGPLYLPQHDGNEGKLYVKYEVIGKNHVAVPTHFFKVVVIETNSGEYEQLSFVMPNKQLPPDVPLKSYLVPVESIERAAGLLLFEKLPKTKVLKVNHTKR